MYAPTEDEKVERELGSADERKSCGCNSCAPEARPGCRAEPAPGPAPIDRAAMGFGPDGAPIDDEPTRSLSLATVVLSNGGRIEFSAVEEEAGQHGIAIREMGDAERIMPSVLAAMSRMSAREIFAKLSPKTPTPRLIAAYSAGEPAGKVTDVIEEPVEADLDELGIAPPVQLGSDGGGGFGGQFCVPGDGWYAFKAFACDGASYPSNTWFWCDPSVAYYWRDRWTSGHKRHHSLGITATCGAPAETRHYYQNAFGNWKHLKTWYLPNQYWQWTRYDGLSNRDRWVRHLSSIQGSPSFVRSTTAIYNT